VTVSQALSMVAFAVAIVYLFVEWHGRERSTGLLAGRPWSSSSSSSPRCWAAAAAAPGDLPHPLFASHVSLALLGYAAFVVAAGYGFLFLELYRELKAARFSTFYGKLPPLEVLERMMTGALGVGFVALTGAGDRRSASSGRETFPAVAAATRRSCSPSRPGPSTAARCCCAAPALAGPADGDRQPRRPRR
jgi:hypothetical protein